MKAGLSFDYVPRRIERCACGGIIAANPEHETDVIRAIRQHQATLGHRIWRERTT